MKKPLLEYEAVRLEDDTADDSRVEYRLFDCYSVSGA